MTWEEQFKRWANTQGENPWNDRPERLIIIETRKAARNGGTLDTPEGWDWVVENESVFVRQRIIPMLSMRADDYSPEIAALIPTAVRIARSHPDPYIRHRIEVQLGETSLLQPIPSAQE